MPRFRKSLSSQLKDFFSQKLPLDSFISIFKKPFWGGLVIGVSDYEFIVRCRVKNTTNAILIAN